MDHKQLLSCSVQILDAFHPRIHGVQEHVVASLAKRKVKTCVTMRLHVTVSDSCGQPYICMLFSALPEDNYDAFAGLQ